ncbi:MAG: hypothetical protein AAF468_10695 [Pseudomonadota bacterium]
MLSVVKKEIIWFTFFAVAISFAQFVPDARAHVDHGKITVTITETGLHSDGSGRIEVRLKIENNTATAATLRRLFAPAATKIIVERQRKLLGSVLWQPVKFLRLEPGDNADLGPTAYRVLIETEDAAHFLEKGTEMFADFGPLGILTVRDERTGD